MVNTEKAVMATVLNLYIPGKSELTDSIDTSTQRYLFIAFDNQYQHISNYDLWYG